LYHLNNIFYVIFLYVTGGAVLMQELYIYITAQLETPREGYDEHSSKSSLSCEPRFIEPVGERTKLPKVDAR
jgi:hypothetical protein